MPTFPFSRRQPQASSSAQQSAPATPRSSTPLQSAGEDVPAAQPPESTALARMKALAGDSLEMLETVTRLAAEAAGDTAVPGLSIGLKSLAEILKRLQAMQTTVEGVETLKERIASLLAGLEEFRRQCPNQTLPEGMRSRLDALGKLWEDIGKRALKIKSRGKVRRFLKSDKDAKKLGGLISEINDSIQDRIVIQGILNVENYVHEIRKDVKAIKAFLHVEFLPRHAKMAHYNSNSVRRSCLEGTRVDFLQNIYTWIDAARAQGFAVPSGGIVLWINGLGGTGKTTVAVSVAERCDGLKILGGSFFCSRSDADCSNPNLIFVTLCRHLCDHHAPFKHEVEAVLERNPKIVDEGLYRQFEELIVRPLEALGPAFPRSVFVLDALDECKDKSAKSIILSVIAKFVSRVAKFLLFIITSRPEEHITTLFKASRRDSLNDTTTPLLLHDVPIDVVIEDIRRYVDYEFEDNIGVLSIEPGWPSQDEKNSLAELSHGLFIHVATAIKFILDRAYGNPKGQLSVLLHPQSESSTPQEFLRALYSTIVAASYERASPDLLNTIRDVLGMVVLAQEPLSPYSVSSLLGIGEDMVRNALTRLHSVLHVPTESDKPIRIIHPTFPEFLLEPSNAIRFEGFQPQSPPTTLELQPTVRHWHLFSRCIDVMIGALKRDMGGIRYPAKFQSEIAGLKDRVDAAIEPHIRYACRFWGHHFRDGIEVAVLPTLPPQFGEFVRQKLLYWLEACCLLDALDKTIFALDTARTACQMLGGPFVDLATLLADCHRFVLAYSSCIHAAPLQIYYCALSIAPTNSLVGMKYLHECEHALVVEHGSPNSWAPCLDAVPGHGGKWVFGITFSHDGSYFATAGWDKKATVWKTATRTPIMSFDGHTDRVNCVAYAPDGRHVASGSDDKRVCVWQPSSGECIHALEGHTGRVYSVAYSGDGRRIVSATFEGEVKLWDTTDGRCLLTLDKTGNETWQVGISPDGGVIARGDSACLSLYDVASSSSEALEFPDTVRACVFSPDGRYIAARSERVIRVWACTDKSLVRSIEVAEDLTSRLAFSRDGSLIGCGSQDNSVLLWPSASEDSPHTLWGHTEWVSDLAYSPDKSQAISVAWDGMVRVWDLASSSTLTEEQPALNPAPPATGPPRFALVQSGEHAIALLDLSALGIDAERFLIGAQMPVNAPTATLFSDIVGAWDAALQAAEKWDTAREWERLTGQRYSQLSDRPLAISPDSALMAYLSPTSDSVVDVCNLCTGTVIATLTGHTEQVRSIAFSPDTTRIATGSDDRSVKVWDSTTGALLCGHTEHTDGWWTRAVAFSPDGCIVASGSNDKTIRIFELATERLLRVLGSHRSGVAQVMFATDNIHLVALDDHHWVYVYDITTGVRTYEFSLKDDSWLRSPVFSPDGTGITVREDHGVSRSVSLWNPGRRTWPVYWTTQDGWVYAMRPGKTHRLCWLPPEWREALASYEGTFCILEAKSKLYKRGRAIVLNMSQLVEYVDSLDTSQ